MSKTTKQVRRDNIAKKVAARKKTVKAGGHSATVSLAKKVQPERRTVSGVARALIQDGKSNEQVLDVLVKEFALDVTTKKGYPAWYRGELRRQKKLSKAALALEAK